uniref:Uncharacterized protein n=1 Tax=Pipistrellus kuhlii TaxID=59472 RepID=A0A7J8A8N5_PIPKU|nr:hypothetical protein mPipKuh1_009044 [Pipistrellus kuhlii]
MAGLQTIIGPSPSPAHPTPQGNPHPDPGHPSGQTNWSPPVQQASILSNKRVIYKLSVTPTHKMAAPIWTQDGQQGRSVRRDQDSRGGQLWMIRPTGEDSWEGPGLQGRTVGGNQACRVGQ